MAAMITIDGIEMPRPSSYTVFMQDLDSEGTTRSETGMLTRDRIRAGVYKIDVSWQLYKPDLPIVISALSPPKITVVFFDPTSATDKTAEMYAGDRQGDLIAYTDFDAPQKSFWELSVSLTEY